MSAAFFPSLLDLLYPRRCGLCSLMSDTAVCPQCRAEMPESPSPVSLAAGPNPFVSAHHVMLYEGRAAQAVRRLKFERITSLARPLSERLVDFAGRNDLLKFDCLMPIPIHIRRRWTRGFNQSELLACAFPPSYVRSNVLVRHVPTPRQVGKDVSVRLTQLRGAFRCKLPVRGLDVLLLDDVFTSGGTAIACAECLLDRGAKSVGVLTLTASTAASDDTA